MRILYITTCFPKPDNGATIYTDLAESLHATGHEITVAVSEQPKNKQQTELKKERGFDVLRIITGNYHDVGYIEKGITTLKIPVLMRKGILKYLGNLKFDLILFESPPVTNADLISWAKKQFNCPAYLMLKDIFPQNAIDIGIIKDNSILSKYFISKEKELYQTADYIGCMSTANIQYLIDHNPWLEPGKLELFPNTKKITTDIHPKEFPIRKKHGIPESSSVFLFGGNMGKPQYIDLLCELIQKCKDEKDIYFMFVGRGTDRNKLENTIKDYKIENAVVIENLPRDQYEQITKECNIGLVVLDPRFTIPNYPSRILSYMEFEKPILAATDNVSDIKELIEKAQCGEWVWSGNSDDFIKKVKEMSKSNMLSVMGENGRKYIEEYFNVSNFVAALERKFNN